MTEHKCWNCKYKKLWRTEVPCRTCRDGNELLKWEAEQEEE